MPEPQAVPQADMETVVPMPHKVVAKFRVEETHNRCTIDTKGGEYHTQQVEFQAYYTEDPTDKNFHFAEATPAGSINMFVNNQAVVGFFQPGRTYKVVFTLDK